MGATLLARREWSSPYAAAAPLVSREPNRTPDRTDRLLGRGRARGRDDEVLLLFRPANRPL